MRREQDRIGVRVYVAAPFADGRSVWDDVHPRLRAIGACPSSSWVEAACRGGEDFAAMTPRQIAEAIADNDREIATSSFVLVLAREGAGGEMFAEARLASMLGIPSVWVGRLTLGAFRSNVLARVETVDRAIDEILRPLVARRLQRAAEVIL